MKQYLYDGLYAEDNGEMVTLSTDRWGTIHYVCLEDETLEALLRFLEKSRDVKITVTKKERAHE